MRKSTKKLHTWRIVRMKATPAASLGTVEAPDAESAIKEAIRQYESKQKSVHPKAAVNGWS
jgi:hypothetical protein